MSTFNPDRYEESIMERRCAHCHLTLDATKFNVRRVSPSGLDCYCRECSRIRQKISYQKHRKEYIAKVSAHRLIWYARLRQELLDAYGRRCACCGESEPAFLTLDHINGGGKKDRAQIPDGQRGLYRKLKKLGWPTDRFRLLCMNCNFATRRGTPCPHTHYANHNIV